MIAPKIYDQSVKIPSPCSFVRPQEEEEEEEQEEA